MIESLYIDNYKCFVDFEWKIDRLQLVVGDNGTGKSTALRIIDGLRRLICEGDSADNCFEFSPHAWSSLLGPNFRLSLSTHAGVYHYSVALTEVDFDLQLHQEKLTLEGLELLSSTTPHAQLQTKSGEITRFPSNSNGSVIATIPASYPGAGDLIAFRAALAKTLVLSPAPRRIKGAGRGATARPDSDLLLLASWIRHIEKTSSVAWHRMQTELREILPGFKEFNFVEYTKNDWHLYVTFLAGSKSENSHFSVLFDDLSDGQKNLIALYAVLHTAIADGDSVFIDEPTNYVAIREIQPWLTAISDRVHETGAQCVLVSHHPEIVDYLAADHGVLFYRDKLGAVRTKQVPFDAEDSLSPAEQMARGWES